MSRDDAVRHTNQTAPIRTPDQLQQAKPPDTPAPVEVAARQSEPRETAPRDDGILGQLETERAYD